MYNNPYTTQNSDAENSDIPVSHPGVNLLLGLLPLSMFVIQIPLLNVLAPLIAWFCVRKDNPESKPAFQGVMNMQISWAIYGLVVFIPCFISFAYSFTHPVQGELWKFIACGLMILPFVFAIVWLAMTILFAVKIKRNSNAKPPWSIRFLK